MKLIILVVAFAISGDASLPIICALLRLTEALKPPFYSLPRVCPPRISGFMSFLILPVWRAIKKPTPRNLKNLWPRGVVGAMRRAASNPASAANRRSRWVGMILWQRGIYANHQRLVHYGNVSDEICEKVFEILIEGQRFIIERHSFNWARQAGTLKSNVSCLLCAYGSKIQTSKIIKIAQIIGVRTCDFCLRSIAQCNLNPAIPAVYTIFG